MYIPFELYKYQDGSYQMFIKGSEANHPEGAMLDLQPLDQEIQRMIQFAEEANLVINIIGKRYTPAGEEEE